MNDQEMTSEEIRIMLTKVEEENLRAIFDKNRKLKTDEDLLELAALTDEDD